MAVGVLDIGRTPTAGIVTDTGPFDLDDFGAEVAKHLCRPGSGENSRKIENAYVRQCSGHFWFCHETSV